MIIKNDIIKYRKEYNLSRSKLAKEINVSRITIYNIEVNKSNVTLETAFKLSNFFKVSLCQLFYIGDKDDD